MGRFRAHPGVSTYILAESKRKAINFVNKKGIKNAIAISSLKDFPQEQGFQVILVQGYAKRADYGILFGTDGLFMRHKAIIFYETEVSTRQ